jgi:hypothetical protein
VIETEIGEAMVRLARELADAEREAAAAHAALRAIEDRMERARFAGPAAWERVRAERPQAYDHYVACAQRACDLRSQLRRQRRAVGGARWR